MGIVETVIGYLIGALIFWAFYIFFDSIPEKAKQDGWSYKFEDSPNTNTNNVKMVWIKPVREIKPKKSKNLIFDKGEDYIGTDGKKYTRFVKR